MGAFEEEVRWVPEYVVREGSGNIILKKASNVELLGHDLRLLLRFNCSEDFLCVWVEVCIIETQPGWGNSLLYFLLSGSRRATRMHVWGAGRSAAFHEKRDRSVSGGRCGSGLLGVIERMLVVDMPRRPSSEP